MDTVINIRKLRAQLSEYLHCVESGEGEDLNEQEDAMNRALQASASTTRGEALEMGLAFHRG